MIDHDSMRTGFAPDEAAISAMTAASMALRWTLNVDGQASAQPLYAGSITIGSLVRDVLIVATSNNSLYALDANSGDVLWRRNFGVQSDNCAVPGGTRANAVHMSTVVSTAAAAGTINRAVGNRALRRSATVLQTSAPMPPTSTTIPVLSPA